MTPAMTTIPPMTTGTKLYLVMAVAKQHDVSIWGSRATLPLTWADGMIGVVPVFSTAEDAVRYADGKYEVGEVEATEVHP